MGTFNTVYVYITYLKPLKYKLCKNAYYIDFLLLSNFYFLMFLDGLIIII